MRKPPSRSSAPKRYSAQKNISASSPSRRARDIHGPLDCTGKPRFASLWERRLTATATKQLSALGMTPQARARIGVDVAPVADLARALSHPDPATRSRLLAEAGLTPGTGG